MVSITVQLNFDYALSFRFFLLWQPLVETGARSQLTVVFQEAIILAILGYIPGFFMAIGLYTMTRNATALPLGMSFDRAVLVFFLTVTMCAISGAIAVRKVQDADPADIF